MIYRDGLTGRLRSTDIRMFTLETERGGVWEEGLRETNTYRGGRWTSTGR